MTQKSDPHSWKEGYTTGSCAAGAAKAACACLKGLLLTTEIEIPLPNSGRLILPIQKVESSHGLAKASVLKNGGDDPDVTHGLEIWATVRKLSEAGEIHIIGGLGVGKVTKNGLAMPVGKSAINPVPRQMIKNAVREIFPLEEIEIIIEVPEGERIATHTLNPRLGIIGGISILGTTGIVRPMSEEAFKTSILPELDQAIAYGHRTIILTPGNYGFNIATKRMLVPCEAVVQMSNFVGFLLEEAAYRHIQQILLLGHIGKLIKVAGGIFHTHNRVADARMEILLAHAALKEIPRETLLNLAGFPTIEGAATELIRLGQQSLLNHLAELTSQRAEMYLESKVKVGTIFTLLNGDYIGWDKRAQLIVQENNWKWLK